MSYTLTRNGTDYKFNSVDEFKSFREKARKYASLNNKTTAEGFETLYSIKDAVPLIHDNNLTDATINKYKNNLNKNADLPISLRDKLFYGDIEVTYSPSNKSEILVMTSQNAGGVIRNLNETKSSYGATTPTTPNSVAEGEYANVINNANDYVSSAYGRANSTWQSSYALAEKARQEAEALAEIQRKRGIVDASTMAEQQKATYGANAEQLGRMGLNVSGYSDYLNSQAYANGMAYRQAANAQATDIKRQATYQEALARLEADKAYSQATAEADKTYYGAMKEIEAAKIADAKAKEAQQQTNYQNFMKLAIENGFTADQITALAPSFGISTEDANKVANTNKALYGENTAPEESEPTASELGYNTIEDIEKAAANLDIDPETRDRLKASKEEEAKAMVQYQIDNGDLGTANAKADELYNANQMSKETYQSTKAELAQMNIKEIETLGDYETVAKDLKKMLEKEQINDKQYNQLFESLSRKIIISDVNKSIVVPEFSFKISLAGKVRRVAFQYTTPSETSLKYINKIPEGQRNIAQYDGLLYYYYPTDKKWYAIVKDANSNELYNPNNGLYKTEN